MKTLPLAQPPPLSAKPAAQTASANTATKTAAIGAPVEVARPPPVEARSGGDWLDARLPAGTAAFQAQLIGQTSLSTQVDGTTHAERAEQLAAYPQLKANSGKADIDVYEPIDVDKANAVDLYI
jgi:hypothetical protein